MRRLAFLLLLAGGAGGVDQETEALLAEIDAEVLRRREGGRGGEADALAAEVEALRRRIAGGGAPGASTRPELHVVYVGSASHVPERRALVRVSVPSRPVVLVLGSRGPVRWHVTVAPGVDVRKILTFGRPDGLVLEVPHAPIEALRNPPASRDRPQYEALARHVEEASGSAVSTFLGAHAPDLVQPFVVGPENPEWTKQHTRREALDLHWHETRARRAAQREELKAFRFEALYRWHDPAQPETLRASFGEWTPLGPLLARQDGLDVLAVATAAVKDAERGEVYFLRHGVLLRYALPSGPPEVLLVPDTLPQVHERCALAVDTRRHRLLLATKQDHGYLYAMDLKSRAWSVVNELDDVDAAGMAYDEQRDALFCLEYGEGHAVRLHRLSPEEGRCQHETVLRLPTLRGARPLAAACVKGRLLILDTDADESRAFVVEPHSGEVLFEGRTRAWEDFAPLAESEMEEDWNELLVRDVARAGRAMRVLAGQGDASVALFVRRLAPEPGTAEDLGRWVALLADDDALVRDLAQHRLVEAGPRAREFLAGIDPNELPPEARRRLGAALRAVGGQERLRRDLRAVQVLERIESPAAEALLRDLAAKGEPRRCEAASKALARIDRPRR